MIDASKNYFVIQKAIFKYVGLSLSPKQGVLYKVYSYFLLLNLVTYPLFAFSDFIGSQPDLNAFLNNLLFGAGAGVASIKHVILFFRRDELLSIFNTLEHGEYLSNFKYAETMETAWIERLIALSKRGTIGGFIMAVFTIAFGMIATGVTQKNAVLPFGTISVLTDHLSYDTIYVYESIALFMAAIVYVTADVIYATIIAHICVRCRILQNFIKRMDRISVTIMIKNKETTDGVDEFKPSKVLWSYSQKQLKEAVLFHIAIFDIAEKAEALFNITVLAEFIGMSVCYCFLMYHATQFSMLDFYFLKDLAVLVCSISTLTLMSYWGNEVINESIAIADACYGVDFVGADARFQKALILIMQRGQRPITLSVGKFATMSLVTMVSFCRACYSYYMLLRKMSQE